jgi:ABC-type nitrate/sulfonate/bicarbonate transport system permease component
MSRDVRSGARDAAERGDPVVQGDDPPASSEAGGLGRFLPAAVLLAGLVVAWEAYVAVGDIDPIVLPAPSRILAALWDFRATALDHAATTLTEAIIGFATAVGLGIAAAVLMDRFRPIRTALYPLLVGSQTIPVIAIAPLLVIWFGFGLAPKIVVIVLVTFFPIVVALLDAFAATSPEATDLLRTLGATERQAFRLLRWPAALPALFTGLRIAVPYAIIGAVFAEYVGAVGGLGIWMQISQNAFRTDLVFGAVLIVAVLSVACFLLVGVAERLMIPWHRGRRRARDW